MSRFSRQTARTDARHRREDSGSRNTLEHICLVVNPRAGAGAAGRRLDDLKRAVDRAFEKWEVRVTEGPRHAESLARDAVVRGAQIVAAVGGDGTCNEVVNGMIDGDGPLSRTTAFTVIPFGTGSDLMKSLQMPRSLPEALWMAATGVTLPTDVGMATVSTESGPASRAFINVAGFGANGDVVAEVNRGDKRMGGQLTFLAAALRAAVGYRPEPVRVEWEGPDGAGRWEGSLTAAFVANGAYCGGGMWVGKGGSMQDGAFDLTLLPSQPRGRQMLDARHLYDGAIERASGAVRVRADRVRATAASSRPIHVDLDGEMPGVLPIDLRLVPQVLQVRGGWLRNPVVGTR